METDAMIEYIMKGIDDEEMNKTILYSTKNMSEH